MLRMINRNLFFLLLLHCCIFSSAQVPHFYSIPPFPGVFCKGQCIQFVDSSFSIVPGDTIVRWVWTFEGTSIDSFIGKDPPILCFENIGDFAVSIKVADQNTPTPYGNAWQPGKVIHIVETPQMNDTNEQTIYITFPSSITLNSCASGDIYKWNGDETNPCGMCETITIAPFADTTFTCIVTSNSICSVTCTYHIKVTDSPEAVYIPNAFTPDGDGINEVFAPKFTNVKEYNLKIFNRWGDIIFSTNDSDKGWNGKIYSKVSETDLFVYQIEVAFESGKKGNYTGVLALIR